jgi:hypothetical protein
MNGLLAWLHPQVDVDPLDRATRDLISAGRYRPPSDHQLLNALDTLSNVWPVQPPSNHLHIFVDLPAGGSPTLVQTAGELRLFCAGSGYLANPLPATS